MSLRGEDKNQSNYEAEARLSAKNTIINNTYDEKFLANRSEGSIFPMKNDVTGKVYLYVKFEGKTYNTNTGDAID